MNIVNINGIAVVNSEDAFLTDVQSALDLIGDVNYQTGSSCVVIHKESITEAFFKLSTGLLGEILQKFVTYGMKLAIVSDFSQYTSKPLKDFICESNKGRHVFFVADEQAA